MASQSSCELVTVTACSTGTSSSANARELRLRKRHAVHSNLGGAEAQRADQETDARGPVLKTEVRRKRAAAPPSPASDFKL